MNFAIVGCGHIARKHAEAMKQISNSKLVAVCDKINENMTNYVREFGATPYKEYKMMLQDPSVDIVNICTPSGTHASLAVQAAAAGKHVVLEKPMALNLEDADQIIRACGENNVKLTVVHPNRFRPAVTEVRELLDDGRLGRLSHAAATVRWNRNQEYYDSATWRGTRSMDGGVLMNQAIHNLDLLLWMLGPIEEIQAYAATRLRQIESEDVAVAVVKFASGTLGSIEAATTIYPRNLEESLSIFGERGTVQLGGVQANRFRHVAIEGMDEADILRMVEGVERDPAGKLGHQAILEDLVDAIVNDRAPSVSGEDGREAVKFVLGILQAADQRKIVRWDEIY